MKRISGLLVLIGVVVVSAGLIRPASAKVHFVVRSQWFPGISYSNVWCYASGTNDRDGYVSKYARNAQAWYTGGMGDQNTNGHSYTGGQAVDIILPDGLVFSVADMQNYGKYHIWNMNDGSQVYTNTTTSLGGSFAYTVFSPMRKLTGLSGGDIPDGSLAAINTYRWGDAVSVIHRSDSEFFGPYRFRAKFVPVPPDAVDFRLCDGLTEGVDYWGGASANYHLVASLGNGAIVCGFTGNTNVWVVNPDSGANTNFVYSSDVDPLQGTLAMPNGEIGLVGANRKIRFYRPTYVGTGVPTLGPVVRSVDLPGTAWVSDACAFKDGTIGIAINYDQTTAANPAGNDVVERWSIEGGTPTLLETMTTYGSRMAHIHGDSAIRLRGSIIVVK